MTDPRAGFSLYLEAAGAGERARRFRESLGEEAVATAREAWSGRILGPGIGAEEVARVLGPPDARGPDTLAYVLPHRAGYLYVFQFTPDGANQLASFFRRAEVRSLPALRTDDHAALRRTLSGAGATGEEVRAVLGAPTAVDGWWPNDTWHYASGLALNLRHGVVEED